LPCLGDRHARRRPAPRRGGRAGYLSVAAGKRPGDLAAHVSSPSSASRISAGAFAPATKRQSSTPDRQHRGSRDRRHVSGFGITRVLSYQAVDALAGKTLVRLLREHEGEEAPIHVLYPDGRHPPPKLRAFLDALVPRLRQRCAAVARAIER
jgi:hypothetical protein